MGHARRLVHPRQRLVGLVAELGTERVDDPVGIAQPGTVGRPRHVVDRQPGHLAQHGVHQAAGPLRRQTDRLADRGVRRHAGVGDLVGAEPQDRAGDRVGRRRQEAVDEGVARPPHAGRAVDQLGDELPVEFAQPRLGQRRSEREVGVRAVVLDPAQARPTRPGVRSWPLRPTLLGLARSQVSEQLVGRRTCSVAPRIERHGRLALGLDHGRHDPTVDEVGGDDLEPLRPERRPRPADTDQPVDVDDRAATSRSRSRRR